MKHFLLLSTLLFVFSPIFANFDKVNNRICSCDTEDFTVGWTSIDGVKECTGTKGRNQSGFQTWSCSKNQNNGCNNPSCSFGSSCAQHKSSCDCTPYGAAFWISYSACRPRFTCLQSASVNLTNATPVSPNEMPSSYTLTQDYYSTIVLPYGDTGNKCEYVCDSGYIRDIIG